MASTPQPKPQFQSLRALARYALAQVEEPTEAEDFAKTLLWADRDLFDSLLEPIVNSALHRAILAEVHANNNRIVHGNRPSVFCNSGEPFKPEIESSAEVQNQDRTKVDGGLGRLGMSILDNYLMYDRTRMGDATLSKCEKQREIYRRARIGISKKELLWDKVVKAFRERRVSDADRLRDVVTDAECFQFCIEAGFSPF